MTIHVSPEVEKSMLAAVQSGRFGSLDEAVTTAWLEWNQRQGSPPHNQAATELGSIGAMRDDADFLDAVVEAAMKARLEQPWRLPAGE